MTKKKEGKKALKMTIFFFYFPENYSRRVCKSTNEKHSGLNFFMYLDS